jgi:hypothetical protein
MALTNRLTSKTVAQCNGTVKVEAAELRGRVEELRARLAEATRPGPVARLIEALATRLTGRESGHH